MKYRVKKILIFVGLRKSRTHKFQHYQVLEQICRQVEEYLSDDYLATDKYLLRQLRSKSEGYLSVKLLTSFKKIKKLTRDWRVTAHALKLSAQVELSTDGHRVKRQGTVQFQMIFREALMELNKGLFWKRFFKIKLKP